MNRHTAIFSLACLMLGVSAGPVEASRRQRDRYDSLHTVGPIYRHLRPQPVTRDVTGDRCATSERARADARRALLGEVKNWLAETGVPLSWSPPKDMLDDMVIGQPNFTPETVVDLSHELNLVRATITADFSDARRGEFLRVYQRDIGGHRLLLFGGGLAVFLAGLAAVSGFIRADEATKGYYTNRLRLLAAAGVGAAGVVIYQILT